MHAAIVSEWGQPPTYSIVPAIQHTDPSKIPIRVLATALHPVVRSRASGQHYSVKSLPHVPGVDGVGKLEDGTVVYFIADEEGTFAETVYLPSSNVFPIPTTTQTNIHDIAARMVPALSSWMALKTRAGISEPQSFSVLILGATGVSGQTAVQVCKALGATSIIAAGRNREILSQINATETIQLQSAPENTDFSSATNVDVVLDYLWGPVAQHAIPKILRGRKSDKKLVWVQIGSIAGPNIQLPSAALRSRNFHLMGSGLGSFTVAEMKQQIPVLLNTIQFDDETFRVEKLSAIENVWNVNDSRRIVFSI
jgi:NADPH:quinone reductase-like Zn-dependent oxidoreductase